MFQLHCNDLKYINIFNIINDTNSVSIHIRRGDYISDPKSFINFGGIASADYYDNAINYVENLVESPHFFIFSDDIQYCKTLFSGKNKFTIVEDFTNEDNYHYNLFLMSACKHNIIGNSSFAWWGAWLNNNSNKVVIAPQKWQKKGKYKIDDICPSGWTLI